MSVSTNVVVMTGEEYAASGDAAFKRGVERGRSEAKQDITLRLHLDTAPLEASLADVRRKVDAKSRPTVYCIASQHRAVETFLAPHMQVLPVHHANVMRGIDHGAFAHILTHPVHVPAEVWDQILTSGWIVLTIDDGYARARAAR